MREREREQVREYMHSVTIQAHYFVIACRFSVCELYSVFKNHNEFYVVDELCRQNCDLFVNLYHMSIRNLNPQARGLPAGFPP
jgi:hypothetical protein